MTNLMARIWCKIMELLDNKFWCTAAYEVAAVHCLFTHMFGWTISETYTDLLRLPILMAKCGGWADGHWCTRPCPKQHDNTQAQ